MRGPGGCGEIVIIKRQHQEGGGEKVKLISENRGNWGPWGFHNAFCREATSREKRSNPLLQYI